MSKIDEYLEKAKDMAEDAGDMLKKKAEEAGAFSFGAKEKVQGVVQGVMQDVKAANVLKQGIAELEALPEFEGSIVYRMDLDSIINDLKALVLVINDNRLDNASVAEEIKEVLAKVQPAEQPAEGESPELTDEEKAINSVKTIAYKACTKALAEFNA